MTAADWERLKRRLWFRIAFGAGVPLALLAGALYLWRFGNPFPCMFRLLTGLYCPGCGAGRAAYALLHFDLLASLSFNPLFVIALPFVGWYFGAAYLKLVFGFEQLPMFRPGKNAVLAILIAVTAFWILRNIPIFPFAILAP